MGAEDGSYDRTGGEEVTLIVIGLALVGVVVLLWLLLRNDSMPGPFC